MKKEILVVVSKIKRWVKDHYGMSVSANSMEALTKIVEKECAKAANLARSEGRKTVMDRDFEV